MIFQVSKDKIYLITKERLLDLLIVEAHLNCLEQDGVDNWTWYMEGKDRFLSDALNLPIEQIRELDYDFYDLAQVELNEFQEYI